MDKVKKAVKAEMVKAETVSHSEKEGFKNYAIGEKTFRLVNNGWKDLNKVEYNTLPEALTSGMEILEKGETNTLIIILYNKGEVLPEIDPNAKDRPYWVTWIRTKKLNRDGTVNYTVKDTALPSPTKKKLLSEVEMLKAKIAEMEKNAIA